MVLCVRLRQPLTDRSDGLVCSVQLARHSAVADLFSELYDCTGALGDLAASREVDDVHEAATTVAHQLGSCLDAACAAPELVAARLSDAMAKVSNGSAMSSLQHWHERTVDTLHEWSHKTPLGMAHALSLAVPQPSMQVGL